MSHRRIINKQMVFVLICIVIQMLSGVAFADFDYHLFTTLDTFSVEEYPDEDCAYIDTRNLFSIADTSFEHEYGSESYYSYLYNDLIVFDYDTPYAYPVWRLWIEFSGSKHIYANSVTFSFGGKDYTFSDILDHQWISQYDNGDANQTIPIVFGDENMSFLFDLEEYIGKETSGQYSFETMMSAKNIVMTLHGTEDVVTALPNTFLLEFMLFHNALIEDKSDISFLELAYAPTPLNVKTSKERNQVSASDINLTTAFPATYAWVTKTEGDYESLAQIYHKTIEEFKVFMEEQEHSIMAADLNSDIRVSVSSFLASIDIKDYSLQTDAQLIEEAQSGVGSLESVLGVTPTDIWILRNEDLAFVCILCKMPLLNQYQIICQTCCDGYFYQVALRGSEPEMLRKAAEEIVSCTEIQEKDRELLQIATGNINLLLPLHWELDSQNIAEEDGLKTETMAFRVHAEDGSSDIAVITIMDLMPYFDSNGSAENRRIFDQVYAQYYFDLILSQMSAHTQDVDYISIHDYDFALLSHPTIDESSFMFGVGYGYAFHVVYGTPIESVHVEPHFEDAKELVAEIISLYQQ